MNKAKKEKQEEPPKIEYSEKYYDSVYEYRQVIFPKEWGMRLIERGLMPDEEWRRYGVQMSKGWYHYGSHPPEPHVLLFRRPIGTDPASGVVDRKLGEDQFREFEYVRHLSKPERVALGIN
ncbi:unnamed protein product [Blepharisma stoltei]|uniref:Cyclin-dependent kinases regulatory subunit n=1 Tax=Blepharisma stoltei TaxID=1481888 RepID=A0AAU9IFZ2_9CILI|nr:unnamed protein product [Blepharisma stoltei]